ncbi:cytochrome c maturation protein CcmE domain-containing protein [Natronorubrum bangense]|uniref:Cytochrome c-type biogenesis protein n=2 Tax=Natronorubrum bangense TaxID=61858 RepID=L9W8Z0_9EURY|nr:cytochrome c maturation protein CcmE [Natronorubrum bangense]ELY45940.1 cytochrome c-type biogenesis protein [Natronorubrum bangense JCM 10635]QCC56632.1 cytochrome c maturation protein CcmE [Natronorubrum bangense]
MNRKVKLIVGSVGIGVLITILALTTMGSAAEFVTPTDLTESDEHEGDFVKLEGNVQALEDGDPIEFDVTDGNYSVGVVYDGGMPETMSEGRVVVAEGHFDGAELEASDLTVRAHEGEHPDDHPDTGTHNESHNDSYDDGYEDSYDETTSDE